MFTPGSVCSAALRLVRHCAAEAIDSRPARARRSKGEIDMHFDTWYMPLQASLGTYLPTILGALAVLLIGWIIALVASGLTRKGLAKLRANERLATQTKSGTDFQRLGGRIVFWIIFRSEEHTSELQSLMRTSYAV